MVTWSIGSANPAGAYGASAKVARTSVLGQSTRILAPAQAERPANSRMRYDARGRKAHRLWQWAQM
jgi:hypothetical protein